METYTKILGVQPQSCMEPKTLLFMPQQKQARKEKGKKRVEEISQDERKKIREEERRKIMKEMKGE